MREFDVFQDPVPRKYAERFCDDTKMIDVPIVAVGLASSRPRPMTGESKDHAKIDREKRILAHMERVQAELKRLNEPSPGTIPLLSRSRRQIKRIAASRQFTEIGSHAS